MSIADIKPDSFISNPLVQAIGSHLGLDAVMGASAPKVAAAAPPPKPPAPRVEGSNTPREFRQHAPMPRATSQGRGSEPGFGAGMNLPGVMSPDVLMHPVVQDLLKQYGVDPTQAAQNADPNLFVTNKEAFEKHPLLSGLLERGLEGAAFTHGSNTVGEGISNVAQGVLNAQAARADKFNNQLMMPIQQATQIQQLMGNRTREQYEQEMIKRAQAQEDYWGTMGDVRGQLAQAAADRAADLKKYHNGLQVLHFQQLMDKTPLDDQGSKEYKDMLEKAGGDWTQLDPGEMGDLLSKNAERVRAAAEKGKTDRANIGAGARIKTTEMNNANRPQATAVYKAAYDAATKRLTEYNRTLAQYEPFEGENYTPNSGKAKAKLAELQKAQQDAYNTWQNNQTLATPGTMPKAPAQRHRRYDPSTGTIH